MRKDVILVFLLILTAGFFFGSCATIFNGTTQTIGLNSYPQGAEVFVNGEPAKQTTPCNIEIKRKVQESRFNKRNEYNYVFKKEGYKEVKVQDHRKITAVVGGNCLTPVFMGFIVDFATGAAYKYNKQIDAELSKDDVVKDHIPPTINILSPVVKRGFKHITEENNLIVQLKVEDKSIVSFVSVNDIKILENEYGVYQLNLKLKNGLNTVNVKAIDSRDNAANEVFTVELRNRVTNPDFIVFDDDDLTNIGDYYALIIGIQDYEDPSINDLDNPIPDAEKLYSVLSSKYNFKQENITFLKNPTNSEITLSMEYYFNNLSENDNLLIFYAGHGFWDKKFKQGYWLPSDALKNNRGTWLANSTIRDYMRGISTRHSLLITDACFSGGIFKSRDAFPDASKAINKLYALPSRKAMTSGALSEVPDKSVFIEYLIKRLDQNEQKHLSSEQLFASFKIAVINNSPNNQVPQFGEVRETGDEGGDFIFIRN